MKTKRQKLALMMADMPHYQMADLAKIKSDYQMRFREPISAAYIIKLYGTNNNTDMYEIYKTYGHIWDL